MVSVSVGSLARGAGFKALSRGERFRITRCMFHPLCSCTEHAASQRLSWDFGKPRYSRKTPAKSPPRATPSFPGKCKLHGSLATSLQNAERPEFPKRASMRPSRPKKCWTCWTRRTRWTRRLPTPEKNCRMPNVEHPVCSLKIKFGAGGVGRSSSNRPAARPSERSAGL